MPPPSPLSITTSSINRLLKEESSYRTELAAQQKRIQQLEKEDGAEDAEEGNREFSLRQEVSVFRLLFLVLRGDRVVGWH